MLRRIGYCVIGAGFFALSCDALADPPTPPPKPGVLDELLVTGERPGPAMWRVSNGDHDLWIFATLTPLPKHMTWRSYAVENRIAQSQVVLAPPEILADVSFFGNPAYAPLLVQAQQIPHRGGLNKLLPNDIYIRWQVLRDQYLGRTYDESIRPIVDASHLFQRAVDGVAHDTHPLDSSVTIVLVRRRMGRPEGASLAPCG